MYLDYELYDSEMTYQGQGRLTGQFNGQDALASVSVTASAVPEPSTYALFCIGLVTVGYARRKMVKGEG